jgi:adenine-specific DNA-methyltransferase
VWEDKPEDVEERLRSELPVLIQDKDLLVPSNNQDAPNHILIEGDNLEALTTLAYTHEGKIDVIYIDPPYNTGNKDFIYNDSYVDSEDSYLHSKWISFMARRLRIAKQLLSEQGVIFISIDDNEQANLKLLCDEIFREDNFVADLIWQKKFSRANDATYFSTMHDHILCYCRYNIKSNPNGWKIGLVSRGDEIPKGYSNPDNDARGVWTSTILSAKSGSESLLYEITTPSGRKVLPPSGRFWSCSQETFAKWVSENRIWFGKNGDGSPRKKTFLSEVQSGLRPNTILFQDEVGNNQEAKQELKDIFGGLGNFDGPKPVRLIEFLLNISNNKSATVLDFFAGSGTTLHATMQLNAKDGGTRKCILVTNNENDICKN